MKYRNKPTVRHICKNARNGVQHDSYTGDYVATLDGWEAVMPNSLGGGPDLEKGLVFVKHQYADDAEELAEKINDSGLDVESPIAEVKFEDEETYTHIVRIFSSYATIETNRHFWLVIEADGTRDNLSRYINEAMMSGLWNSNEEHRIAINLGIKTYNHPDFDYD